MSKPIAKGPRFERCRFELWVQIIAAATNLGGVGGNLFPHHGFTML